MIQSNANHKTYFTYATRKQHFLADNDAPPSWLQLDARNPRAIYEDVQRLSRLNKRKVALTITDDMDQREISDRDIVSWGTIIAGFAHRRQRESLNYLRQMMNEGIYLNSVVLTTILPVIGDLCARKFGQEIHCYVLKKRGYMKQLPIQSGLIDVYCQCGDIGSGRRVFYSSMERNVISWTALMSGYASNERFEEAMRSMVCVVAIATAIPICAELRNLKYGKEAHAYAIKHMFLPNISVTTSPIKMYSECGILNYSVKLFEAMVNPNVISRTAMIDAFLNHRRIVEAFWVFRSMLSSKARPDSIIITRMLSACGVIKASSWGERFTVMS